MALTILPATADTDDYHLSKSRRCRASSAASSASEGGMSLDSDSSDIHPTKRIKLGNNKPSISRREVVVPGEPITDETQWMRGHGTTTNLSPGATLITATLAGPITPTNKLL